MVCVRQAMQAPSSCEGSRVSCLFGAEALTKSAVGQASIERANRIPAKSVPGGYATHTHKYTHTQRHTHCLSFSLSLGIHTHILSVSVPLARTHAHTHSKEPYESMEILQSSYSTTCNLAPLDGIIDGLPLTICMWPSANYSLILHIVRVF